MTVERGELTHCAFGREEHDGARFCHEHIGFLEAGDQRRICDRHPLRISAAATGERRANR